MELTGIYHAALLDSHSLLWGKETVAVEPRAHVPCFQVKQVMPGLVAAGAAAELICQFRLCHLCSQICGPQSLDCPHCLIRSACLQRFLRVSAAVRCVGECDRTGQDRTEE